MHWHRIGFWAALWWFIYTTPTQNPFLLPPQGQLDGLRQDSHSLRAKNEKEAINDSRFRLPNDVNLAPVGSDSSGHPIILAVTPKVCLEVCTARYSAVIEKNQTNRRFYIHWEADDFEGTDERPHEGTNAPYQIVGDLKDLPGGSYTITACIYRLKEIHCDETTLEVSGR